MVAVTELTPDIFVELSPTIFPFALIFPLTLIFPANVPIPPLTLIPFLAVIIGLYYVKVRIDSSAGLGKKRRRELKQVIVEAITESGLTHKNS